jgi:DNA-directed RNA polymerase subunit M/transcription elongation factor TFIIS
MKKCTQCDGTLTGHGSTSSGSPRLICKECGRTKTISPKKRGRKTKAAVRANVVLYEEHLAIVKKFNGKNLSEKIRAAIESIS